MRHLQFIRLLSMIGLLLVPLAASATGDCSDYEDLTGQELPITVTGSTVGATADYGPFPEQPSCWQGVWDASCANSGDVTYKWTAPHDGAFTFTLFGSSSNADLSLYQFTCPVEPVYPDDFICGAHRSWMSTATLWNVELAAGQEILIVVDGWLIWNGDFTLRVDGETTTSDMVALLMDIYRFCGTSVASIWDGEGRYVDGIGLADVEQGIPVADDHLFCASGVSEAVTGTALMQLWEQGLFTLDQPVDDHLLFSVRHPDYPEIPITFRMLLSRTSSIADVWSTLHSVERNDGQDSPITPCEFVEGYLTPGGPYYSTGSFRPEAPGTVHWLTSVGPTLIACLVEHINPDGLTFADYCREFIFDPLQMTSSSFLLDDIDPDKLVTQHFWSEQGDEYMPIPCVTSPVYPGMYLRTNAEELSRLLLAYMRDGELYGARILESATIDTMLTAYYPDLQPNQGLVWYSMTADERDYWGLWSGQSGVHSRVCFHLEDDLGAVAISNSSSDDGLAGIFDVASSLLRWADQVIPTGIGAPGLSAIEPSMVQLAPSVPNPFNPRTSISFGLPAAGHVQLTIHDVRGHLVATLLNEEKPSGHHSIVWNGRYHDGREAPSGAYFSRLEAGGQVAFGRMMLVR